MDNDIIIHQKANSQLLNSLVDTDNEEKIPRMEGVKRTAEILGLPVHFVRAKVLSGEVVAVRAGRRFLVNVDKFIEYLNTNVLTPATDNTEAAKVGRVYPIDLRR